MKAGIAEIRNMTYYKCDNYSLVMFSYSELDWLDADSDEFL